MVEPDLPRANLSGASLKKAYLVQADLREADLQGADLRGADLSVANLSGAELIGADLRRARLFEARFVRTSLSRANLSLAEFGGTLLGDTDLSGAIGLESCKHGWESVIDFQTLAKSGNLPLVFLRGCGLPDALIEYLPSLLSQPIQYESCFISHSTRDKEFADWLFADLQNKGVRCWFAPHDGKAEGSLRSR